MDAAKLQTLFPFIKLHLHFVIVTQALQYHYFRVIRHLFYILFSKQYIVISKKIIAIVNKKTNIIIDC